MTLVTSYTKDKIDELTDKALVFSRKTSNYELVLGDAYTCIEMNVGSSNTLTIPANASVAFVVGTIVEVSQYGAGVTTITPAGGVTLRSLGGLLATAGQYARVKLEKVATNEWYVSGDLA